jgi:hypothetical protein
VRLIRACHAPLELFQKHATILAHELSLLSPYATWFATYFFIGAKILDVKEALKQTVIDMEWDMYERAFLDMQKKCMGTQAREVMRLILGDDS